MDAEKGLDLAGTSAKSHAQELVPAGSQVDLKVFNKGKTKSAHPNRRRDLELGDDTSGSLKPRFSEDEWMDSLTLEKVTKDELLEPFTRRNFELFLMKEQNEEYLDFLSQLDRFKNHEMPNPVLLRLEEEILNEYIVENAPNEINISGDMRSKTINNAHQDLKKGDPNVETFKDAREEVIFLLNVGSFARFKSEIISKNISLGNSRTRYLLGFTLLLMACIICFISLNISYLQRHDGLERKGFGSRAARLVATPLFLIGFFMIITARLKICPINATFGLYQPAACTFDREKTKRHNRTPFWHIISAHKTDCDCNLEHHVKDKHILKHYRKKAMKVGGLILAMTMVALGLFVALP